MLEQASESFKIQILREDENGEEVLSIDKIQADQSPIIRLVDSTVFDALNRRASDIHIETRDTEVVIKYRIDGVLQPAMKPIAKEHHSTIISRIKVMAELDIAEKRVPQDGRFRVRIRGRSVDFRVSIMPSVHGEDAVIRILDKESLSKQFTSLRLDVLGFDEKELARFRRFIREPYGMVLVTGPTGSGKTTTLYAALSEIKTEEDKIITIEDPVEYQLQGHHPDPGEREEGAHLRPRPALDPAPRPRQDHGGGDPRRGDRGHRHPVRAHRPPRVHHRPRQQRDRRAGPLPQHEDRALQLRLRPQLRAGPAPGAHDLRALQARGARVARSCSSSPGLDPATYGDVWFYEGAGCLECGGTGYKGRMAISELLDLSDSVRELILARRSSAEIKRAAREEGMVFLRESAVNKALAGHTTLQEINKVTFVEVHVSAAALAAARLARGRGRCWLRRHFVEPDRPAGRGRGARRARWAWCALARAGGGAGAGRRGARGAAARDAVALA